MKLHRKKIHRSLILGSAAFIAFLCFLLSIQAYLSYSKSLYKRYNDKLNNILVYISNQIDMDDLYQSSLTGVKSEKYPKVQNMLNGMVDDFDLFYLYSLFTRNDTIFNICSATSKEERERGEEDMKLLEPTTAYQPEEVQKYTAAINKNETSFFEEDSDYGAAYTACKPYVTSTGVHFGVLCADISIEDLHKTVNNYIIYNIMLTLILGMLFGLLLIFWLRHNVTGPIQELERSARHFAEKSHNKKTPDELIFDTPDIHTDNEVESLSDTITQMSKDMRNYVQGILTAEEQTRAAQQKVAGMAILAFKDALTHVNSKVAYEKMKENLQDSINKEKAVFAIVMIDVNNLKAINDNYGHDCGDKYIFGSCHIICGIYKHSPVYRIGGDEFLVLLRNSDYENRDALLKETEEAFKKSMNDTSVEPWERYSAAFGMSEYQKGDDVDAVFKRADENMYRNKASLKHHQP